MKSNKKEIKERKNYKKREGRNRYKEVKKEQ